MTSLEGAGEASGVGLGVCLSRRGNWGLARGVGLVGASACTASVSAGSCELVGAGAGAGAGLAVCSSGVAAMSWLGGAGLEFAGAGEIAEGCVPVGWSGPGTVSWLVGVGLVGCLCLYGLCLAWRL